MFRTLCFAALTTTVAFADVDGARQHSANFVDTHAQQLVRASRTAVGRGPQAVERLQALILRGRSRVAVAGFDALVSGDVEIRALLPRHFVRVDRAGVSERTSGFADRRLLSVIREGNQIEEPPGRLRDDILKAQRAWYGRLMLGIAAHALPDLSLTFRSVFSGASQHTGDLRDGTLTLSREGIPDPNIFEATGPDSFFVRIFLDTTRIPERIEYRTGRSGMGTMRFGDRREVGGLLLPYRITTIINERVVDDLMLEEIVVNPELSAADFK